MAKFLRSQEFKNTFKQNLTCIFCLLELIQKTQFAMTDPVRKEGFDLEEFDKALARFGEGGRVLSEEESAPRRGLDPRAVLP